MAEIPIFTVDSFSDKPFAGNPAGVCLIPHGSSTPDDVFQKIAAEMNISETSFIEHLSENSDFGKDEIFNLRWFTPTTEVELCGHATLAAAAVLFQCAGNTNNKVTFRTKSGPLIARRHGTAITLDFPLNPVQTYDREIAMPVVKEFCDPDLVSDVQYNPTLRYLVLRLKDGLTRKYLEELAPDTRSVKEADTTGRLGLVILTVRTDTEPDSYDFVSRVFAPWLGISEDPVTGSAFTVLADFWRKEFDKSTFKARQCSKRGGDVIVNIVGERVELTGNATVVLRGTIAV